MLVLCLAFVVCRAVPARAVDTALRAAAAALGVAVLGQCVVPDAEPLVLCVPSCVGGPRGGVGGAVVDVVAPRQALLQVTAQRTRACQAEATVVRPITEVEGGELWDMEP